MRSTMASSTENVSSATPSSSSVQTIRAPLRLRELDDDRDRDRRGVAPSRSRRIRRSGCAPPPGRRCRARRSAYAVPRAITNSTRSLASRVMMSSRQPVGDAAPRWPSPCVRSTNGMTATDARRRRASALGRGAARRRVASTATLAARAGARWRLVARSSLPRVAQRRPVEPLLLERADRGGHVRLGVAHAAALQQRLEHRFVRALVERRELQPGVEVPERLVRPARRARRQLAQHGDVRRRDSAAAAPTSQPVNSGLPSICMPSSRSPPKQLAQLGERSLVASCDARRRRADRPRSHRRGNRTGRARSGLRSPSRRGGDPRRRARRAACSGTSAARRADRSGRPTADRRAASATPAPTRAPETRAGRAPCASGGSGTGGAVAADADGPEQADLQPGCAHPAARAISTLRFHGSSHAPAAIACHRNRAISARTRPKIATHVYDDISQTIGRTPVVRINRLAPSHVRCT